MGACTSLAKDPKPDPKPTGGPYHSGDYPNNVSPEWCAVVDAELSRAGVKAGNSHDVGDWDIP